MTRLKVLKGRVAAPGDDAGVDGAGGRHVAKEKWPMAVEGGWCRDAPGCQG